MFTLGDRRVIFAYVRNEKKQPIGTLCCIKQGDVSLADGVARCNPVDQFSRETGRKLAMARALRAFPRDERKRFWDAYFTRKHAKQ